MDGKHAALQRLARLIALRDGAHIQARIARTDGCEALRQRVQHYLPEFTLILDFIHANEYLWKPSMCEADFRAAAGAMAAAPAPRLRLGAGAGVIALGMTPIQYPASWTLGIMFGKSPLARRMQLDAEPPSA